MRGADLRRAAPRRPRAPRPGASPCRPSSASSRWSAQIFLISAWAMSSASRISASGISFAPRPRPSGSPPRCRRRRGRGRSSSSRSSSLGLTTKLPSILPIRTAPTGVGERDVGDHQRRRGAVHREDVVGVHVVDRERDRDQLRVVVPALGEQRAASAGRSCAPSACPSRPARPSRLKNEPGIFPAAYMRSSTSTVSGRKSTSR